MASRWRYDVAPFTGAWIEITEEGEGNMTEQVAPFTGAWIEIPSGRRCRRPSGSLPSRERGLKYRRQASSARWPWVAPFTGAWIEMALRSPRSIAPLSLPSRERGLKSPGQPPIREDAWSLPSRERGLKLGRCLQWNWVCHVAPFTGAWIEILSFHGHMRACLVAPFTGAWIEIWCNGAIMRQEQVAPFTGAWIEICS